MRVEMGDGVWSQRDLFVAYPLHFSDLICKMGANQLIHAGRGVNGSEILA